MVDSLTSVQLLELPDDRPTPAPDVELAPHVTDTWLAAFYAMSGMNSVHKPTIGQMLQLIMPETRFAAIRVEHQIVACGIGVLQDGFVGLFDIVTATDFRGRGYGRRLVHGLLAWGARQGAHTAYLQVMLNNEPALNLYAKLGFREAYRYWYRIGQTC